MINNDIDIKPIKDLFEGNGVIKNDCISQKVMLQFEKNKEKKKELEKLIEAQKKGLLTLLDLGYGQEEGTFELERKESERVTPKWKDFFEKNVGTIIIDGISYTFPQFVEMIKNETKPTPIVELNVKVRT